MSQIASVLKLSSCLSASRYRLRCFCLQADPGWSKVGPVHAACWDFSPPYSSSQRIAVTGTMNTCSVVSSAGWNQIRGRMGHTLCPPFLRIKGTVIITKPLPAGFVFLFVCAMSGKSVIIKMISGSYKTFSFARSFALQKTTHQGSVNLFLL